MAKKKGKLAELNNIIRDNKITGETVELNDEIIFEIKKKASQIQDYRHESYIRHYW